MRAPILVLISTLVACGEPGGSINEQEVITTVVLEFRGSGGGTLNLFEFDDPDGDGGNPPIIDDIILAAGVYTLDVRFENRLEAPTEDITAEVEAESDQHLLLFTGTAPLVQEYDDEDANGLPIGLANTVTATPGAGTLTVTLRHMPPEEPPVKAADTVDIARADGIDAIGGSTDASVTFDVTIQ